MAVRDVLIRFRADTAGLKKIGKDSKELGRAAAQLKKFAAGIGVAVGGVAALRGSFRLLSSALEARKIQDISERKLERALDNLGEGATGAAERLKKLAASLQLVTDFGDEQIINAQALLLTFREVGGEKGAGLLTERMLDIAAALSKTTGQTADLQTIAQALGRALAQGAGALTRYGISMSEAQKSSFNAAKGMEKVRLLTEILDDNFEGLARATVNPIKQLGNAWSDLTEELGRGLLPVVERVAAAFRDFTSSADVQAFARNIGTKIGEALEKIIAFVNDNKPAIAELAGAFSDLFRTAAELGPILERTFTGLKGTMDRLGLVELVRELDRELRRLADTLDFLQRLNVLGLGLVTGGAAGNVGQTIFQSLGGFQFGRQRGGGSGGSSLPGAAGGVSVPFPAPPPRGGAAFTLPEGARLSGKASVLGSAFGGVPKEELEGFFDTLAMGRAQYDRFLEQIEESAFGLREMGEVGSVALDDLTAGASEWSVLMAQINEAIGEQTLAAMTQLSDVTFQFAADALLGFEKFGDVVDRLKQSLKGLISQFVAAIAKALFFKGIMSLLGVTTGVGFLGTLLPTLGGFGGGSSLSVGAASASRVPAGSVAKPVVVLQGSLSVSMDELRFELERNKRANP